MEGITDREYYTNSFHVPVYYPISAYDKIKIEAPYHALTNAGHISYIEMDGDPSDNLEAFEKVIRCMKENGIGYGSVNHPVDRDPVCGFSGIIGDQCPGCGRTEADGVPFERIRRINRLPGGHPGPLQQRQARGGAGPGEARRLATLQQSGFAALLRGCSPPRASSPQSPLAPFLPDGKNYACSLAAPLPMQTAALGLHGGPKPTLVG